MAPAPNLSPASVKTITAECVDALSEIIIANLSGLGFDGEGTTPVAESTEALR